MSMKSGLGKQAPSFLLCVYIRANCIAALAIVLRAVYPLLSGGLTCEEDQIGELGKYKRRGCAAGCLHLPVMTAFGPQPVRTTYRGCTISAGLIQVVSGQYQYDITITNDANEEVGCLGSSK